MGYTANCYSQPSSEVWHHLAVVFDKSQTGGDEVKFYVDGALQTVNWSLAASSNTNNFGNNPLYLFSRGGASEFNSGAIDDFRIYNTCDSSAHQQPLPPERSQVPTQSPKLGPQNAVGTPYNAISTFNAVLLCLLLRLLTIKGGSVIRTSP